MSTVTLRLAAAGITLPDPVAPIANYVPFVRTGNLVHISGQVSLDAAGGITGIVGVDVDKDTAVRAARLCGVNLLAQMRAACDGDLDRVVRVVKLGGFVQAGPDFYDIPAVINGYRVAEPTCSAATWSIEMFFSGNPADSSFFTPVRKECTAP